MLEPETVDASLQEPQVSVVDWSTLPKDCEISIVEWTKLMEETVLAVDIC